MPQNAAAMDYARTQFRTPNVAKEKNMPNEQDRAKLSIDRGTRIAGRMKTGEYGNPPNMAKVRQDTAAQGDAEAAGKLDSAKMSQLSSQGTLSFHKGGRVMADGVYSLKAGEHVLTAKEAALAKKHALMHAGMKSLAQRGGETSGEPQDTAFSHAPIDNQKVRPEGSVSNDQGQMKRSTAASAKGTKGNAKSPSVRPVNASAKVRPGNNPVKISASKSPKAGEPKGSPSKKPVASRHEKSGDGFAGQLD